jgi:anti-sigma factor RsiW
MRGGHGEIAPVAGARGAPTATGGLRPMIDCHDVRIQVLAYQRGTLAGAMRNDITAHLRGCTDCARHDAGERALTDVLERQLPQHPASLALKRRLAAQWPAVAPAPRGWWKRPVIPALAAALVLVVAAPLYFHTQRGAQPALAVEAVNDHLRILDGRRPLEVQSGGMHQVKPWFQGRLDFAPVVAFAGDDDFPLKGGAVDYFLDRKAAVFVYGRRLHTITLLVMRADGLAWPPTPQRTDERGFNVIVWRTGDLGYALVSDVDAHDLSALADRLTAR